MIANKINALTAILLAAHLVSCYQENRVYSGYALLRASPQTSEHVHRLLSLTKQVRVKQDDLNLDFWTLPKQVNSSVDIMVSPEGKQLLYDYLSKNGIPSHEIIEDIRLKIKKTKHRIDTIKVLKYVGNECETELGRSTSFFSAFQRYQTIESKLQEFASDSRVIIERAGTSHEKRKIYLIKVSTDHVAKKPIVFVDAGHHAREWISHTTLLYLMEVLLNGNFQRQPTSESTNGNCTFQRSTISNQFEALLQKYDFWFIPVVNPDGYEYTHEKDRLWRKTRSRGLGRCLGVDPNRNYPFHWNESGSSRHSCSEIYSGPKPLSEPECQAVANALNRNSKQIVMYISLHAYSQLLLTPYGYDSVYPENYAEMEKVAKAGVNAIYPVRQTVYKYGPSSIVIYTAAGGSDDYAHGILGIRHAYTIELPDTGHHGFLVPPKEIMPIGHETVVGIAAMIEAM